MLGQASNARFSLVDKFEDALIKGIDVIQKICRQIILVNSTFTAILHDFQ